MITKYCSDCTSLTEVLLDCSTEIAVCTECGLIIESNSVDETYERRPFDNESGDNGGDLSTIISKPKGGSNPTDRGVRIGGKDSTEHVVKGSYKPVLPEQD